MGKIKDIDVLNWFRHIFEQADNRFESVKAEWNNNMVLYLDNYSFPDKLDWQATIKDPQVDSLITRLANFFTRVLISSDNQYFTVKHKDPLTSGGLRSLIEAVYRDNKYPLVFNDSLKLSLLTSPYINKVEYTVTREKFPIFNPDTGEFGTTDHLIGRTRIKSIDPFNIRLDPDGDSYIIELEQMTVQDFIRTGEANDWFNLDKAVRKAVDPESPGFNQLITLHHVYTHYITDARGRVLDEDVHFIVVGDTLVHYIKNLLPRGLFPYTVGFPLKFMRGRYGKGYISKLSSLILNQLEMMNLLSDAFKLATLGAFEIVADQVERGTEHAFTAELRPGRFYPVKAPNTIRQIFTNDIPALGLNVLFAGDRILQNRSFQTEFFQGMPTVKGRPTASEIITKTQESTSFFTDIASEIERSIIEPGLFLVLSTELLYMDDPAHLPLEDMVTNKDFLAALKRLSFNERMEALKASAIEARGISGKVLKLGNFQKILSIVNVLGNMPTILAAIDPAKFLIMLFDSFDFSPDLIFDLEKLEQLSQLSAGGAPVEGETEGALGVPPGVVPRARPRG